MSNEVFTDSAMLEIFRAEVETHAEALTAGLLALERDPSDTSHIDEMMRAAHSVKGAARIVGIEPAVRVAHVMEDGFIAAQKGDLTLQPWHIDVLLRGVDMLTRVANSSREPKVEWTRFDAEVNPLVAEITAVLSESPASVAPARSESASPSAKASAAQISATQSASPSTGVTIPLPTMLDANAAEVARRAFVSALDAHAAVVNFDLSLTSDLDATGLALLAAMPGCAGGTSVQLSGTRPELRTVLQATGIERLYAARGR